MLRLDSTVQASLHQVANILSYHHNIRLYVNFKFHNVSLAIYNLRVLKYFFLINRYIQNGRL